jgi:type II secretory pathway pseudopilin PulG
MNKNKNLRGFSLIDIIIALGIASLLFFSIYELFIFSTRATYSRVNKTESLQFAEEGIEAVRTLRNRGWDTYIGSKSVGTNYYLTLSGDQWTLGTTPTALINSLFTRTIVFNNVNRDGSGNISTSGTLDPDTKKVTVTVSWQERGNNRNLSLATYVTNFLNN